MIDFYEIAILKLKIIKESIKTFYLKEFIKIKRGIVDFVDKFFLVTLLILLGVYAIGEI